MDWWKILLVIYIVAAIPADILVDRMLSYNRARSIYDDQKLDAAVLHAQSGGFVIKFLNIATWPLTVPIWLVVCFLTWRARKKTQENMVSRLRAEPDGFDETRETHRLAAEKHGGSGMVISIIITTYDDAGRTDAFCVYGTEEKLKALAESKQPIGEWVTENIEVVKANDGRKEKYEAMGTRPDLVVADPPRPYLTLVKSPDPTGLTGMWFYGREQKIVTGHVIALHPMILNLMPDAQCAFLPVFSEVDHAVLERELGCNVKENGLSCHEISDSSLFLQTLGGYAIDRPVRIVKNVRKTSEGQWTFDTICEVRAKPPLSDLPASGRAADPGTRPPVA